MNLDLQTQTAPCLLQCSGPWQIRRCPPPSEPVTTSMPSRFWFWQATSKPISRLQCLRRLDGFILLPKSSKSRGWDGECFARFRQIPLIDRRRDSGTRMRRHRAPVFTHGRTPMPRIEPMRTPQSDGVSCTPMNLLLHIGESTLPLALSRSDDVNGAISLHAANLIAAAFSAAMPKGDGVKVRRSVIILSITRLGRLALVDRRHRRRREAAKAVRSSGQKIGHPDAEHLKSLKPGP